MPAKSTSPVAVPSVERARVEVDHRRSCRDEITRLAIGIALIMAGFAIGAVLDIAARFSK